MADDDEVTLVRCAQLTMEGPSKVIISFISCSTKDSPSMSVSFPCCYCVPVVTSALDGISDSLLINSMMRKGHYSHFF